MIDTVRAHLEAIRDRHRTIINGIGVECGCGEGCANPWPCPDYADAVAALELLDEATQVALVGKGSVSTTEDWRLIFDPDSREDA